MIIHVLHVNGVQIIKDLIIILNLFIFRGGHFEKWP